MERPHHVGDDRARTRLHEHLDRQRGPPETASRTVAASAARSGRPSSAENIVGIADVRSNLGGLYGRMGRWDEDLAPTDAKEVLLLGRKV